MGSRRVKADSDSEDNSLKAVPKKKIGLAGSPSHHIY